MIQSTKDFFELFSDNDQNDSDDFINFLSGTGKNPLEPQLTDDELEIQITIKKFENHICLKIDELKTNSGKRPNKLQTVSNKRDVLEALTAAETLLGQHPRIPFDRTKIGTHLINAGIKSDLDLPKKMNNKESTLDSALGYVRRNYENNNIADAAALNRYLETANMQLFDVQHIQYTY